MTWTAETGLAVVEGQPPSLFVQPSLNVVMRCFNSFGKSLPCGPDKDNDFVLNQYDCHPLNQYLRYDLDQDGICDEITGGDEADCLDECNLVYSVPYSVNKCEARCRNLDNCPCLDPNMCPFDSDFTVAQVTYAITCQVYRDCIDAWTSPTSPTIEYPWAPIVDCDDDAAEAQACQDRFANPGQEDGNANNRGDHCESRPQGIVTRFVQPRHRYLSGDCWGETYDVEVLLEGCGGGPLLPLRLNQRTTVGACGCADPNHPDCIMSDCPEDNEEDSLDGLAWEGIHAPEVATKRNVGDPGTCLPPACPLTLDQREPLSPDFMINKYQSFTHDYASNRHFYNWQWRPTHYVKDDLRGKYARVRVAWQDPGKHDYAYRDDPSNIQIAYSDHWELMEFYCEESATPLNTGIDQPEYYERPRHWGAPVFASSPYPYAIKHGAEPGETYLVSYGPGMRAEEAKVVTYKPGAEATLSEVDPATASACLDPALLGLAESGVTDVLFRYGGTLPGGELSNALWIGLPSSDANRWYRAEEIYGADTSNAPLIEFPRLIHDARNQRLVLLGNEHVPYNGQVQILANQIWTFDLVTGHWTRLGSLPIWWSWVTFFTVSLDPLNNRAILIDGTYEDGWSGTTVFSLDLETLKLTEKPTTLSDQGPFAIHNHGAYLEPLERAVYVYGGTDIDGASTRAYRLDLRTWTWTYLGNGDEGPGERTLPYVSYELASKTLWVSGGYGGPYTPEIVFWGYRDGQWFRKTTLEKQEIEDWHVEDVFDPLQPKSYLVKVDETVSYPGNLYLVKLVATDLNLGMQVMDSHGNLVGSDLSANLEKTVSFYGHSLYLVEVLALPGLSPTQSPGYTLDVAAAQWQEVGSYMSTTGVNDLLVKDEVAYVVGHGGLEAVSLVDPTAPQWLSSQSLGGPGLGIALCGEVACVAKAKRGSSLKTVDISDPAAMQVLGALQTPGVSRQVGAKGATWVYLSDGGAGVSIIDVSDPAQPVRVGSVDQPGVATALHVAANRLYVGTHPQNRVYVYDITAEQAPVLLGTFQTGAKVEAMRVNGEVLHVAGITGQGWQGCISGKYCPPGTQVEVYDISDPAAAGLVDIYSEEQQPAVHMKTFGNYALVRTDSGFTVYRAVPLD